MGKKGNGLAEFAAGFADGYMKSRSKARDEQRRQWEWQQNYDLNKAASDRAQAAADLQAEAARREIEQYEFQKAQQQREIDTVTRLIPQTPGLTGDQANSVLSAQGQAFEREKIDPARLAQIESQTMSQEDRNAKRNDELLQNQLSALSSELNGWMIQAEFEAKTGTVTEQTAQRISQLRQQIAQITGKITGASAQYGGQGEVQDLDITHVGGDIDGNGVVVSLLDANGNRRSLQEAVEDFRNTGNAVAIFPNDPDRARYEASRLNMGIGSPKKPIVPGAPPRDEASRLNMRIGSPKKPIVPGAPPRDDTNQPLAPIQRTTKNSPENGASLAGRTLQKPEIDSLEKAYKYGTQLSQSARLNGKPLEANRLSAWANAIANLSIQGYKGPPPPLPEPGPAEKTWSSLDSQLRTVMKFISDLTAKDIITGTVKIPNPGTPERKRYDELLTRANDLWAKMDALEQQQENYQPPTFDLPKVSPGQWEWQRGGLLIPGSQPSAQGPQSTVPGSQTMSGASLLPTQNGAPAPSTEQTDDDVAVKLYKEIILPSGVQFTNPEQFEQFKIKTKTKFPELYKR